MDLAADAVQVILFVDANGDGALDEGEAAVPLDQILRAKRGTEYYTPARSVKKK